MKHAIYTDPHDIIINRRRITLTHCEKVLFPQNKITKGDLVDYYLAVAPHMIPYIADRPLTLHRFVGMTYAQIATEMGVSKRTVCKNITEAVIQFRGQFSEAFSGA